MGSKLLVVDDDATFLSSLSTDLSSEGFGVATASDGLRALATAVRGGYDVIMLNVRLPGVDGGDLCRELRRLGDHTPVLMFAAEHDKLTEARVLNEGADDYLVKPFDRDVLLARMRALLRRSQHRAVHRALSSGDLVLDPSAHTLTRHGQEIKLTPTEAAVLAVLMRHPGQVISRRQILNNVWDLAWDVYPNIVDVYVSALRRKLGQQVIMTVHGVGYRLAETG